MPVLNGPMGFAFRLLQMINNAATTRSRNADPRPIATYTHTFPEDRALPGCDRAPVADSVGLFSFCESEESGDSDA